MKDKRWHEFINLDDNNRSPITTASRNVEWRPPMRRKRPSAVNRDAICLAFWSSTPVCKARPSPLSVPFVNEQRTVKILTSIGGAGVARLPSSGKSGGWPQAESAVLLQRLSVLPPPEQDGGPKDRDW